MNFALTFFLGFFAFVQGNVIQRDTRIVHGHEASRDEHPYVASIQIFHNGGYYHFCGGSLIREDFVLSAAHCIKDKDPSRLRVVIGAHDLGDSANIELEVEKTIVHPYDDDIKKNDVALLKLKTSANSALAKPIALSNCDDVVGQTCLVSGWGRSSFTGPTQKLLMEAEVTVVSNEGCAAMLDSELWDPASMMCAGGKDRDACQGDSGGPLVCQDGNGVKRLQGIISWGIGCATPGVPGVYTDLCKMGKWIRGHMGQKT